MASCSYSPDAPNSNSRSFLVPFLRRGVSQSRPGYCWRIRRVDVDLLWRGSSGRVGEAVTQLQAPLISRKPQDVITRPNLLAGEEVLAEPRQKRSQAKRARLKAAALALFGERGYEATSVEDIVSRAHMAMGSFYQHYRSKRQLLLALMDELLEHLSRLELRPKGTTDIRSGLRELLSRAFSTDLRYLGAYRAWQEAALSDSELAAKQREIHAWTTARVLAVFNALSQLPGARSGVNISALARVMDSFFWNLLAQAPRLSGADLRERLDVATHLIYHALFRDKPANGLTSH
jgi:AcrR family transcriptional regulator